MSEQLPNSIEAVRMVLGPAGIDVSRETGERLTAYVALLEKWQARKNLVAPSTLPEIWTRHVADGAQALATVPHARRWVDLGSGAGFPGLVTAILLAGEPGARVDMVEANAGKVAFLRAVVRETGAPAIVHSGRIEALSTDLARTKSADYVSARALAPLARLLHWAAPWFVAGASAVFHKGQDFVSEIEEATLSWDFHVIEHASKIDPNGRLLEFERVVPKSPRVSEPNALRTATEA